MLATHERVRIYEAATVHTEKDHRTTKTRNDPESGLLEIFHKLQTSRGQIWRALSLIPPARPRVGSELRDHILSLAPLNPLATKLYRPPSKDRSIPPILQVSQVSRHSRGEYLDQTDGKREHARYNPFEATSDIFRL